jgi:hypothetical protein
VPTRALSVCASPAEGNATTIKATARIQFVIITSDVCASHVL